MLVACPTTHAPCRLRAPSSSPAASAAARAWGEKALRLAGAERRRGGAGGRTLLVGLAACCGVGVLAARRPAKAWQLPALWKGGRRSGTRVACAAGAGKPERTTLYTKAGPDGTSLGDCPFSHSVQMALRLKGVDFDIVPCTQDTKPQWLLDEVNGKMPCVLYEGTPHVETSEILAWIEEQFPEPSLAVPDDITENAKSGFGLFGSIAKYTKNTDASEDDGLRIDLQMKLASVRAHLARFGGEFINGDAPTLLDCDVLPKLYVLETATAHFKNFSLDAFPVGDEIREYYDRVSQHPAFADSLYPADVGIWGWEKARSG